MAPTTQTTYSVTVTVTGGCSSSATKQVNVFDAKWDNVTVNATCNKLLVDANFAATGNFVVSYTYGGQTFTEPSTGSFSSTGAFELTGQGPGIYSNITIKRASSPVCTAVWPESMTVYASCDAFECPGNLIVNPSFENGTTGWDFSGGNLVIGNYAAVFGLNSGQFQITNGSDNWLSQVLPGTYTGGSKIDLSVYAGTHNPSGFYNTVGFDYFDTNWNWKGGHAVEVNSLLPTMTKYMLTGTVQANNGNTPPANNTYYVTVRASGTGDWIKTDGWCVVPQVTSCNVSISGADNVCVGDSVYLTATSTSGTPVSYSWSTGGTSSTKRVGPTTNTTYTVTATFSNGCTATASKTITVSNPPSITQCEVRVNNSWSVLSNCIAAVNVGDDVALSINPNTFPAGYTQVWEGPNGFTATGNDAFISSSITAAQEGNYTVIVSNGICTISQNIYISVNQTDDCTCLSGNLVSNGDFTNGYTSWGRSSYDDSGITACSDGINKAYISNGSGAEAVLFQEITSGITGNTKFTYSFMAGTHSPSGTHKARVKFYNASGSPLGTPLNLEIDHDVDAPANSWCLNLESYGPYEFTTPANTAKIRLEFVEVTTDGGYIKVANVDLKKCNTAPVLNLVATNPLCNGLKGSVSFTTSGGSGTKTVRLNGNIVTSPVTNLAAGTYVFTVTDASACSSTKSVTITQPTAITATTTKVDGTCATPNSGSINLTVSGGTPTYTFSWSNGATTEDLSNLTAGTYTVTVTDANGCTASSSAIITAPPKYTIGDLVWLDVNADGVQNGGAEVGISDVTVTLYKASNNTQVDQTTTNGSGIYSFLVCPDTYYIIFGTKSGYNRTTSTGLVTVTTNSDASVVDGKTSNFTVASSNINYVDAGLTQIAALGDRVWLDNGQGGGTANDGLQNGTEPGVVGVTVNLYKDLNNDGDVLDAGETTPFATMMTGANGIYNFIGLTPGNYQVGIVVPSGYDNTIQTNATNDGANDATGSDFVPATDRSYIV
ncbi:MAG: SdrD B-like domain-containing protein, partial [Saprospiraceae bacterium]